MYVTFKPLALHPIYNVAVVISCPHYTAFLYRSSLLYSCRLDCVTLLRDPCAERIHIPPQPLACSHRNKSCSVVVHSKVSYSLPFAMPLHLQKLIGQLRPEQISQNKMTSLLELLAILTNQATPSPHKNDFQSITFKNAPHKTLFQKLLLQKLVYRYESQCTCTLITPQHDPWRESREHQSWL